MLDTHDTDILCHTARIHQLLLSHVDTDTASFLHSMTLEGKDLLFTDVFGATSTTTDNKVGLQILPRAVYLLINKTRYSESPLQRQCFFTAVRGGKS